MWKKVFDRSARGFHIGQRRRHAVCSRQFRRSMAHSSTKDAAVSSSTALKNIIFDKIRVNGPITVADYMKLAASSYYSTTAAATDDSSYGIGADFVTSPEISQMFGELIGVWCAYETWKMGHRDSWQLVELGPGNGSLMHDCLNTLRQVRLIRDDGDKHHQLSVHLVELSEALAARQERLLCSQDPSTSSSLQEVETKQPSDNERSETAFKQNKTRLGPSVFWYKDLEDVARQFSVIIAHEFFDALPVHKFQRTADGKWREIYVDADFDQQRLKLALAPTDSFALRTYLTKDVLERLSSHVDHVEISPQSAYLLQQAIDRITEDGGAMLIIDYGYDSDGGGDTLRAFRKHKLVNDFLNEDPGSCDITADVNFAYLKRLAQEKACVFGPITQGEFLKNLGIEVRLKRLLAVAKSDTERDYLKKSFDMLVGSDRMGSKFKVMAIFPKVLQPYLAVRPPAGFCDLQ